MDASHDNHNYVHVCVCVCVCVFVSFCAVTISGYLEHL
jgi:hypothetical protein